jgi:hypothetical protein
LSFPHELLTSFLKIYQEIVSENTGIQAGGTPCKAGLQDQHYFSVYRICVRFLFIPPPQVFLKIVKNREASEATGQKLG